MKKFERLGVQWLTVIANEPFYVRNLPGGQVPYPVLADPAATVSAVYGVAFQVHNKKSNGWANRPAKFVIDRQGAIRCAGDSPEEDMLQVIRNLEEERALIEGLKGVNAELSRAAALALKPLGPKVQDALPALARGLKNDNARVRTGAAVALCWVAPQAAAAVPALVEALQDKDGRVPRRSAVALGRIGPQARAAVPALIRALKNGDEDLRAAVRRALKSIDPKAARKAGIR
jgi:hypothetical protein